MSDNVKAAEHVMNDVAVYWPPTGTNDAGEPTYGEADEIACFWMDVHELFRDKEGNQVVSKSMVIVDRDLEELGMLWHGALEDVVSQSNPKDNPDTAQISRFERIPDRKGTRFFRQAIL